MENNLRLLRLRVMLTFTDNLKGSGVQMQTQKYDPNRAPQIWYYRWYDETGWNMLQVLHPFSCMLLFCELFACARRQQGIQIQLWSVRRFRWRVATRKSTHMQNWHEEVRNEGRTMGMRGWIKQSPSLAGGTFNNSKASFTLEDGLCMCVCVCEH